jgi:CHAT domain-containing protein
VREVTALHLDHACLAYLSACTTAFGGTDLTDESIHIASAFQLAGFRHVIATLWAANNFSAKTFADTVYTDLLNDIDPAHAVHRAMITLRRKYPDLPYLRASHIHFGP